MLRFFWRRAVPARQSLFITELCEERRLLSAIGSDQTVTGTISTPNQVDSYTFSAAAGGSVYAAAADTVAGSPLTVVLALRAPDGTVLKQSASATGTSILATNLAQAGTYTLNVSGQFGTLGSYAMTLALPGVAPVPGTDAGPIASGAYHTAAITAGDLDVYTIAGTAGGSLLAAIGKLDAGSPFTPTILTFSPSGALLGNTAGATGTNDLVRNLPATGTYYVVAADQFSQNTGNYGISIATFGGPQTVSPGDEGGPIPSGAHQSGAITPGDFDVYTISGTSGGSLLAAIGKLDPASPFTPTILTFSPSGTLLTDVAGAPGTNTLIRNLPASGTYYVVALDQFSQNTGNYGISVATFGGPQTVSPGDEGGPIASGAHQSGAITPGDFDVYTISATSAGSLLASIGKLDPTSPFTPTLLIFSPTGVVLSNVAGATGTNTLLKNLAATGTYYVVALDQFSQNTGNYGLSVARFGGSQTVSPGEQGGPLASGAYRTGAIALGDFDVYTMTASAGQTLVAAIGDLDTTSPFVPTLLVFSPTGDTLSNVAGAGGANLLLKNLPATGTYAIVALDQFGQNTGRYGLTAVEGGAGVVQTVSPGDEGGPLNSAERRLGTIAPGDIDAYTFTLAPGNGAFWTVGQTVENSFSPRLIIMDPNGTVLSNTANGKGSAASLPAAGAVAAGTYTALVLDAFGSQSGEYALTGVAVPAAQTPDDDGGALVAGQPRAGALPPGDADVYNVTATAGQKLTFNLAKTGTGSLSPEMIVYRPDGSIAGASGAQVVVNSAAAGNYTIVVADSAGNGSGAYSIGLNTPAGADTFPPKLLESAFRFNNKPPEIRLAFSEDVSASFQPDTVVLKNLTTNQTIDPANLSITFTHYANEIDFGLSPLPGGVLPDGNYRLTIPAAKLTDVAGNPLTQDVSLDFFVLAGDANRDRTVGFADLLILAQNYNGTGRTFSQGDFNYDGKVDFSDLLILAQQYNKTLPPPAAAAPAAAQLTDLNNPFVRKKTRGRSAPAIPSSLSRVSNPTAFKP